MADNKDHLDMDDIAANLPAVAALSQQDRDGLVNALKSKLRDLAGDPENVLGALPPKVRKRVEALRQLQGQHDELEAKFLEERAALEAKYQKLYQPLYSKRYDIVTGAVEVEEVTNDADGKSADAPEEKGVPNFWLNALKTHEVLAEEITERDEGALQYLKDIKWYRVDDPKGFKLEFLFDTNPYFKNTVLTKTYHMIDEDEPILEKAIGTEIEWYPGKCVTEKLLKKKSKKGGKPITKTEKCESFFNFFNPPQVPEDDDDIDEDVAEELQNEMEQDYEIGSTIRDKIIPHAVSWFTGEAAQEDGFDVIDEGDEEDDDDDEDDEDEDEDEEDEDDDDDEEEEVPKARKKKGGKAPTGEQPPDCKQQ